MEYLQDLNKIHKVITILMNYNKKNHYKDHEDNYNRKFDCSINKASNELMLHRICGGKDIEFPFCSLNKE